MSQCDGSKVVFRNCEFRCITVNNKVGVCISVSDIKSIFLFSSLFSNSHGNKQGICLYANNIDILKISLICSYLTYSSGAQGHGFDINGAKQSSHISLTSFHKVPPNTQDLRAISFTGPNHANDIKEDNFSNAARVSETNYIRFMSAKSIKLDLVSMYLIDSDSLLCADTTEVDGSHMNFIENGFSGRDKFMFNAIYALKYTIKGSIFIKNMYGSIKNDKITLVMSNDCIGFNNSFTNADNLVQTSVIPRTNNAFYISDWMCESLPTILTNKFSSQSLFSNSLFLAVLMEDSGST